VRILPDASTGDQTLFIDFIFLHQMENQQAALEQTTGKQPK